MNTAKMSPYSFNNRSNIDADPEPLSCITAENNNLQSTFSVTNPTTTLTDLEFPLSDTRNEPYPPIPPAPTAAPRPFPRPPTHSSTTTSSSSISSSSSSTTRNNSANRAPYRPQDPRPLTRVPIPNAIIATPRSMLRLQIHPYTAILRSQNLSYLQDRFAITNPATTMVDMEFPVSDVRGSGYFDAPPVRVQGSAVRAFDLPARPVNTFISAGPFMGFDGHAEARMMGGGVAMEIGIYRPERGLPKETDSYRPKYSRGSPSEPRLGTDSYRPGFGEGREMRSGARFEGGRGFADTYRPGGSRDAEREDRRVSGDSYRSSGSDRSGGGRDRSRSRSKERKYRDREEYRASSGEYKSRRDGDGEERHTSGGSYYSRSRKDREDRRVSGGSYRSSGSHRSRSRSPRYRSRSRNNGRSRGSSRGGGDERENLVEERSRSGGSYGEGSRRGFGRDSLRASGDDRGEEGAYGESFDEKDLRATSDSGEASGSQDREEEAGGNHAFLYTDEDMFDVADDEMYIR